MAAVNKRSSEETSNKLSIATFGMNTKLDKESSLINDIIHQTTLDVQKKFGQRTGDNVIDSFTRMNLSSIFDGSSKSRKNEVSESDKFKELMSDNAQSAFSMITAESGRLVNYENYKAIVENIPEMAFARDTYISNILSPDDYTKSIFNVLYTGADEKLAPQVGEQLKDLIEKYRIEEKAEKIISDVLTYADSFLAVLPYDREIAKMLASTSSGNFLNEALNNEHFSKLDEAFHLTLDKAHNVPLTESILSESITTEESNILNEVFGIYSYDEKSKSKVLKEDGLSVLIEKINNNIHINSTSDLLRHKAQADMELFGDKVDIDYDKKNKSNKNQSKKLMNINGAALQFLEADRVVELKIGDVCYGYYYIELGAGQQETPYNAESSKMYAQTTSNPFNPTLNKPGSSRIGDYQTSQAAQNLNVTDEKLQLIANVILKALGKRFNRNFITSNKEFKDLLYSILKQRYIIEKGVSVTYFLPEEVIHFRGDSIFEKITYFAKIYLAVLTNIVLIKLGRSHDKRIFYVNVGADSNHEQAIAKVIQDVKTKEFRMGSLGSIYTILSLNPGAFDDYYMPTYNGEKPVDIETIQGMDQDINNEFLVYLRNCMIEGTGLPQGLLEAKDNIEFARQISAQNANFCRRVIRYQKILTEPFEALLRLLYKYEYRYTLNDDKAVSSVNLNEIHIKFPSPGTLNLANLTDSFSQVDQVADYISKVFVPDRADQSTTDEREAFKQKVIQRYLPQVEWDEIGKLYETFKVDNQKKELTIKTKNKRRKDTEPQDDGGYGSY